MYHYGIIGNPLEHSFSQKYFTDLFVREGIDADYTPYPLTDIRQVRNLHLDGYNVTYPYKETIIPYLSELSPEAKQIGAVNVVKGNKGYNTDYIGFLCAIQPHLNFPSQKALILGTGGVAKAIMYACSQSGIEYTLVSHSQQPHSISYTALTQDIVTAHLLIIQCTPLGMYPDIHSCVPFPFQYLTPKHILFDCIYNPPITRFLQHGTTAINGYDMLLFQARATWKIWATP